MRLQGIYGEQKTIAAKHLRPGMVTVWNFGYQETVKSVVPSKTGKTFKVIIVSENGKEYERKLGAERHVAIR